jgi:hypothetical protein
LIKSEGTKLRVNFLEPQEHLSVTDLKGCGQTMIWSEIPPLDKDLLKELMDSGLLDFLNDKRKEPAEQSRIYQEIT